MIAEKTLQPFSYIFRTCEDAWQVKKDPLDPIGAEISCISG